MTLLSWKEQNDRIVELEEMLGLPLDRRRPAGIGPTSWKLAALLALRGVIVRELSFQAIYGGLPESDQPKTLRVIDQNVSRLRRWLRRGGHKIKIESERGGRYYVYGAHREALRRLVFDEKMGETSAPRAPSLRERRGVLKMVGNDRCFGFTGWSSLVCVADESPAARPEGAARLHRPDHAT